MGLCLSIDSYTSLSQRSPLWWEAQTLKKSQTIKVNRENTPVNTEALLFKSSEILLLSNKSTISVPVSVADSLYTYAARTFTQLWGVASLNRQLALQTVYFLCQGRISEQEPRQLQPELSRVLVHQSADLTQGRPGHRLHDGGEL